MPMYGLTTPPDLEYAEGYDHLPLVFRPPKGYNPAWRRELLKVLPVPHLPHGLACRRKYTFQPPKFYYGWPYTDEVIIEHGTRRGYAIFLPNHPPLAKYFNPIATQDRIIEMLKELGIRSCTPGIRCCYTETLTMVALTSNYPTGNRIPPAADVEKIQEFLGYNEPPMWYLSSQYGSWDIRSHTSD